ncbi:ADAM 17-like protease [Artemia franciscana]|uniref:ADAM 17-like protease n=1 Tax=Artemia franciscana TaxID=6661 RepID=A0AA88L0X2_ARTSF|nr:hypothetical protein QYM36_014341 [Artemia franciscana]
MMGSKILPFLIFYLSFNEGLSVISKLRHFETLSSQGISHSIVKRGIHDSSHPFNSIREVNFKALGKDFRLILNPRKGILHPNFQSYEVDRFGRERPVFVDDEEFFEGRVFGEISSSVKVHMSSDGILTASIRTAEDTYHVEPSWRHLRDAKDNNTMIAYKGSDVIDELDEADEGMEPPKVCAYVRVTENATDDAVTTIDQGIKRDKRQADGYNYVAAKTRCPLLLVADYRFQREMGGGSSKNTINYLISLVDRVHSIYAETVFRDHPDQTDGAITGMGFVIKKIIVHSEPNRVRDGELHYNMERSSWDVRTLLEVFSREYGHKDYCLAHLFTDIKFDGGILGLAYVGSPRRNSVGGICTPEYFKSGYTLYLNSGLSSSRNHYGQRVITREADLVTAHEFGHNWGSEHDPDQPECSPTASQGGSYLMYTYSVSGYDINNKKFSPCSLRSIRAVLLAKASRCFAEPEESFCGNQRVEGKEECDAGLLGSEDSDPCCDKHCHLRRGQGAVCSDKNSPCCKHCQLMPAGVKCRDSQVATCEQESRCTNLSPECPPSPPMPDGTGCIERGQCRNGTCLPFCETQGLQSCMCDTPGDACKRCCRVHLNDTCFAYDPTDILPDGTPCVHGFCNNGICEKTVQDIVERFWDIIEDITINKVMDGIKSNLVGVIVAISAIIWIPASCIISYIDRRKRARALELVKFRSSNAFLKPGDSRRVYYAQTLPRNRSDPCEIR